MILNVDFLDKKSCFFIQENNLQLSLQLIRPDINKMDLRADYEIYVEIYLGSY